MGNRKQPYVKTRTVKQDDELLFHEYDADGNLIAPGEIVRVTELTRTMIKIEHDDGGKIILGY